MSRRPLDFDTGAETLYTFQNLYRAYLEARSRKRGTMNVLRFEYALERNLSDLLATLRDGTYRPNRGVCFVVTRPVIREVFAADFRDRVVHHLYVRSLEKFFEASLDPDSYACRKGKGTVAASDRLASFVRKATANRTREAYCLKLDVAGFFTNIPRDRLLSKLKERIARSEMSDGVRRELLALSETFCFHDPTKEFAFRGERWLLDTVPRKKSLFHAPEGCGIPIGNLTSQFFANVYLDDLDRYVKRVLRIRHYARYVDDFVLLSESKEALSATVPKIRTFLKDSLGLTLHPKKISLQSVRR